MPKYLCENCTAHIKENEVLEAPNPFSYDDTDTVLGCPECRACNEMIMACDSLDCWQKVSGGYPLKDGGYAWRCDDHTPAASELRVNTGMRP